MSVLPDNCSVTVTLSTTWDRVTRETVLMNGSTSSSRVESRSSNFMVGVAGFLEAVMMISRRRGIPRVTLAAPCPAKWKVLSVIWVDGSPTLLVSFHVPATESKKLTPEKRAIQQPLLDQRHFAYT